MLEERGSTVYRGVLTSGCWKRGFHCIQRCPHFRERGSTVYRGVLTSGRGVPLYTEVSSLQGEGFHCIQRCPHFRERGSTVYRGVLTSGRGVPLYTEVSSLQGEGFHCIQRRPHYIGMKGGCLTYILVLSSFVFPNRFISDHGSVKASASSISLGVSILAGATEKGQPNVTSTGCDFNVGHLSVKLNGGAR